MIIFIKWMPQHTIVHKMAARTIIICLKKLILHFSQKLAIILNLPFFWVTVLNKTLDCNLFFIVVVSENVKFYFPLKII